MIKYVIFDWGGVCTRGHLIDDFSVALSQKTGAEAGKIKTTFDSMEDPYEIGRIEPGQFWEEFRKKLGLGIPAKQIQAIFINSYVADQATLDYILELKKEYKTALVTNNYHDMLANLYASFKIDNYFGEIFCSSEIHLRKPDKEIYEYVAKQLGIDPGEAIFVDDKEKNTAAARALGFETVTFINLEDLKQKINLQKICPK